MSGTHYGVKASLGQAPSLAHKHLLRDNDKQSSLLRFGMNYDHKSLIVKAPSVNF
jgi:hypothetical protein